MDRRLYETCIKGSVEALDELVREDELIIDQVTGHFLQTPLHLAAQFGHVKLVAAILRLRPTMVGAENWKMATPIHEACQHGNAEILSLLLDKGRWAASKVNSENETPLLLACRWGRLDVVRVLLNESVLLVSEFEGSSTCLHLAASGGYTEIVREILKARPHFASRLDESGMSPLHLSSRKGHVGATSELVRFDSDLSLVTDKEGWTALHMAATKGSVAILSEILSASRESMAMLTSAGDSVLHLGVKNNRVDMVKYVVENMDVSEILNMPDRGGNTILHLAVAAKLPQMVKYIVSKTRIDINMVNLDGLTALDMVGDGGTDDKADQMRTALENAGAKHSRELPQASTPNMQRTEMAGEKIPSPCHSPPPELQNIATPKELGISSPRGRSASPVPSWSQHQQRPRLRESHLKNHSEGLRNSRNTITVVAVLIATVTFAAVISPPGGVYDQGELAGKAIMATTKGFKIFMVCNDLALFSSLSTVIILISIVPFQRRVLTKLLSVTQRVTWASVTFMVMAYMAATCVILPRGHSSKGMLVAVYSIGWGTMGPVFVGLFVLLVRHRIRKEEFKKGKMWKSRRSRPSSQRISDVEEARRPSSQRISDVEEARRPSSQRISDVEARRPSSHRRCTCGIEAHANSSDKLLARQPKMARDRRRIYDVHAHTNSSGAESFNSDVYSSECDGYSVH
ncbi:ankyrin repeat-containing protein At2g01680-like [Nymphaea colorata]|nr:ankyrin repeat-containing protein At2g01680-like [Nymphaea colorata]